MDKFTLTTILPLPKFFLASARDENIMYPIKLGFKEAQNRINALMKNGHSAEALVTSVFTLEKLMRRCLRVAILARGFTSKHADDLLDRKAFYDLKDLWEVFDIDHRELHSIIGNTNWQHVPEAVTMRNKLVHGQQVYDLKKCEAYATHAVAALKKLHETIRNDYGTDPWATLTRRTKPKLEWHTVKNASTPTPSPKKMKKGAHK
jgi:hypothetical protein